MRGLSTKKILRLNLAIAENNNWGLEMAYMMLFGMALFGISTNLPVKKEIWYDHKELFAWSYANYCNYNE